MLLNLVRPGDTDTIITPKLDRCFPSALDARDVWTRAKKSGGRLVDDAEEQEAISTMLASCTQRRPPPGFHHPRVRHKGGVDGFGPRLSSADRRRDEGSPGR